MKKIFIIGIILVLLVIGASLFINGVSNQKPVDKSQESIEVSKNGVTLLMPGDWEEAASNSNTSVMAVADPKSKDSSGFSTINVNIEKKPTYNSLDYEYNANINKLARNSDHNMLYEGNVTIFGESGREAGYTSNSSGVVKQHKSVWFKKGDNIYVILCTAPEDQFANEESTFDFILSNMKIK